jgi:hypothetical protein
MFEPKTWEEGARSTLFLIANNDHEFSGSEADFARMVMDCIRVGDYDHTDYADDGRYALDQLAFGYDEIIDILADKQRKYGPDNILGFGHQGIRIRMHDKCARILNCDKFDVTDDENPFFDFLGYCVVGIMLERGWFELPLATPFPASASAEDDPSPGTQEWRDKFYAALDALPSISPVAATEDGPRPPDWVGQWSADEPVATYIPTFVAYWDGNYQMMSYTWSGDKITVEYQRLP